jgi:hypothetical protein
MSPATTTTRNHGHPPSHEIAFDLVQKVLDEYVSIDRSIDQQDDVNLWKFVSFFDRSLSIFFSLSFSLTQNTYPPTERPMSFWPNFHKSKNMPSK